MVITKKREKEFWLKVDKTKGCWIWKGYKDSKKYGGFYLSCNKRMERSHRISFFLSFGKWPEKSILHSCDNPSCVNPEHLREGSQYENMQDARKRKRFPDQKQTHCKRGHELSEENVYANRLNRDCKLCRRVRYVERLQRDGYNSPENCKS